MNESSILDLAGTPQKIKKLSYNQLKIMSGEIRNEIIESVSKTGGHLASNLGTVEITLAILKCFDVPQDKVVWDVGHQCYTYKMLTDRRNRMDTLRQQGGISGFPKCQESRYDAFISGHASTSLSVGFGLKRAMTLNGEKNYVVVVIGDGALSGGMAFEGINNIGKYKENIIVILNDNEMSISKSEGALAKRLAVLRSKPEYFTAKKITDNALRSIPFVGEKMRNVVARSKGMVKQALYPSTFFEEFGFTYYGPIDGHNIKSICEVLAQAKTENTPALIHVQTVKGKGYVHAEENPGEFHGVGGFDILSGCQNKASTETFSDVFGKKLLELGRQNKNICAITAAMEHGTGLHYFAREFKSDGRYYDVGIAEELAVTFSAALSAGGKIPVLAIYSTFLQRGYDQLIHDASIEKRHIVIGVDRAGIVGDDGETHQGLFDAAFLSTIPNMTVYSPSNYDELKFYLEYAINCCNATVAIRYPRGNQSGLLSNYGVSKKDFDVVTNADAKCLVVTYGRLFAQALEAFYDSKIPISLLKLNKICPIPSDAVDFAQNFEKIIFLEEGIKTGGIGSGFITQMALKGYKGQTVLRAIDEFVAQGKVEDMLAHYGLDTLNIMKLIEESETGI